MDTFLTFGFNRDNRSSNYDQWLHANGFIRPILIPTPFKKYALISYSPRSPVKYFTNAVDALYEIKRQNNSTPIKHWQVIQVYTNKIIYEPYNCGLVGCSEYIRNVGGYGAPSTTHW